MCQNSNNKNIYVFGHCRLLQTGLDRKIEDWRQINQVEGLQCNTAEKLRDAEMGARENVMWERFLLRIEV